MDYIDPLRVAREHGFEVMERFRRVCLPYLSKKVWTTLILVFERGNSQAEAAEILGIAANTVSDRLKRAKRVLEAREAAFRREAIEARRQLEQEE